MDNNRASAQGSRREKQYIRDRDRMSLFNARKTGGTTIESRNVDDWAEDVRYDKPQRYDDPPARTSSGRGRRAFKGGRKSAPPSKEAETPASSSFNKYRSTTETPPSDELRYDISSLGTMTPQQDKFLFNHTADGFLNVVEQCFNKMVSIDGRITRKLPYAVFLHNMTQLYYVHMITIADTTGQQSQWAHKMPCDDYQRMLSADTVQVPEEIWFWLKGLGQWKDKEGLVWIPNFPYVMAPRAARAGISTGGDFGTPNVARHNVYENHIAPYTTRAYVTAMLADVPVNNVINYAPLPQPLTPAQMQPTANFLGFFANNRRLHPECLAFYEHYDNHWAQGIGARLGYNSYLWAKMNTALVMMKDKMKMRIGLPPTNAGSQSIYGTIFYNGPSPILRIENGTIESTSEMDPQSLAIAVVNTYRRRRDEERPGTCYVAANGDIPNGWIDTINSEYELLDPFQPQVGDPNDSLNTINFTREITEGRYNIILEEIKRLTVIQNRR